MPTQSAPSEPDRRARHAPPPGPHPVRVALSTLVGLLALAPLAALTTFTARAAIGPSTASVDGGMLCPPGTGGAQVAGVMVLGVAVPLVLCVLGLVVTLVSLVRHRPGGLAGAVLCGVLAVAGIVAVRVLWPACSYG